MNQRLSFKKTRLIHNSTVPTININNSFYHLESTTEKRAVAIRRKFFLKNNPLKNERIKSEKNYFPNFD